MIEFLVEAFEPRHNGGVLPPLLAWASGRVAASFQLHSAVGVLHDIVTVGNDTGSSLQRQLDAWLRARLSAHAAFFVVGCLTVLLWLVACLLLLGATVVKERRRRRRRRAAEDAMDAVDGVGGAARASRYLLFADMLRRRARRLRQRPPASTTTATATTTTTTIAAYDVADAGEDSADGGGSAWPDAPPMRVANVSTKTLRVGDRALLGHTAASLLLAVVCLSLLAASLATAGNLVTFTSTAYSSGGVRAIATSTVEHVDVFLTRSLAESNATIFRISEEALPHVQRLFLAFGQQLLDSLLEDYNITPLIAELQKFLGSVNSTMETMQLVSRARVSTITPLQNVTNLLNYHRSTLQFLADSICERLAEAGDECRGVRLRLPRLAVRIDSKRLDTDTSVTIVTLLNRMLNLNISQVQQQIAAAQAALSNSLNAISDVVRSLFDNLVAQVSAQFSEAELLLSGVKTQYEAAVADPRLWSTVGLVHAAVVALLVLTGVSFAIGCLLGGCLVAFLLRHLRIGRRLDRYVGACEQPPQQPALAARLQDANNNRKQSATLSGSFGEHWLDLEAELSTTGPLPPLAPPSATKLAASPHRRRKVTKLAAKELNSFVYCCPNDCSVLLLVAALFGVLPLLLGSAFFYFSAEVHVDACRYVASSQGRQQWDSLLDNFTATHVWPKVDAALRSQVAVPISIGQYPTQLLRSVSSQCSNSSRSLFDIFGLLHLVNASAILQANATRQQFEFGAKLLRDQINATDVNSLIPPELDAVKAVLPQIADVMDSQNHSGSVQELSQPLLLLQPPELRQLLEDLHQLAEKALAKDSGDREAAVLQFTVDRVRQLLANSTQLEDKLKTLKRHFQHLQESRVLGQLTARLLAALKTVEETISDKDWMLRQVDVRFYSILDQHLPKFAAFLDPLAVSVLQQVGFCDDLSRAYHTISGDFCSSSIPPINTAAFLLFVTTIFFGALFLLCWLLLLRVRRHQTAVAQFELLQLQANSSC